MTSSVETLDETLRVVAGTSGEVSSVMKRERCVRITAAFPTYSFLDTVQ